MNVEDEIEPIQIVVFKFEPVLLRSYKNKPLNLYRLLYLNVLLGPLWQEVHDY